MRIKKTEAEEKRERLREELEHSPAWPRITEWVADEIVTLYRALRTCKDVECARLQGELSFAERILGLQKNLKTDEILKRTTSGEGE